jgi:cysteine-rich repeat protein
VHDASSLDPAWHVADRDAGTFNWLFGDGGSSPNRLSYHTYQNGGRYEAVVTVPSGPEVARCRKNIRVFRCGDGQINGGDQCDYGNRRDDDGCSSTCQIETGYVCKEQPSLRTPICGDGLLRGPETKPKGCDDGNTANGDGCDSTRKVEPGFTCVGEPSVCT